jgi:hypothetical protein
MPELTLEALILDADLEAITYFEVSGVRSSRATPSAAPAEEEDIEPSHSLQTAVRDDDKGFRIRIRTEIDVSIGSIIVDVSADYELATISARSIDQAVLQSFVNGVAVMALVPYIRQSVSDITLRVFGSALTMALVRRGEMEFELSPTKMQGETKG